MKQYTLLSLFLLLSFDAFSQCAFTISANNPTYCPPATGLDITVNVTGGIAPFTYQLGQGVPQAGNVFPNVAAGIYTIYVTDASPCMDSIVVTGNAWPLPNVNITATPSVVCSGGTTVLDGFGAVTYTVTGGVWFNIPFSPPATTTYTMTGADANGCTATSTVTVTVSNIVMLNTLSTTNPTCIPGCDGTALMGTIPGVAPFVYSVSGGANNINNAISNICANTNYTVTCTDINGCVGNAFMQLGNANAPVISISGVNNVTCNGSCDGTAQASASGGIPPYIYSIIAPGVIDINTGAITALCAGTYTVTVSDANSCSSIATFVVTEPTVVNTNIISTTSPTCTPGCDGIITVTANGGVGGILFTSAPNAGQIQNPAGTFTGFCAGTNYIITATDANGCTATTNYTFTTPNAPIVNISNITDVTCNGLCDGTAQGTATGGTPPYTYMITAPGVGNPATGFFTALCAGAYTVQVIDANSCMGTTSFVVTEPNLLTLGIASSTPPSCVPGCDGLATTLTAGGTPGYTYTVTGGALNVLGFISNVCSGTIYTIHCTDANACSATTTLQLITPNSPTITISTTTMPSCIPGCDGTLSTLTAGGTPPYNYVVSGGAAVNALGDATNLCAGNTYTMTVTDANACTGTTTLLLANPPSPTITIGVVTDPPCNGMCNGTTTTITSGGTPPYVYSISGGATINIMGNASNLCGGAIYTITVLDANGCTGTTTTMINQPPVLNASVSSFTNPTCNGITDGTINVIATGGTGPNYNFLLYPGAVGNVNGQFTNLGQGVYTIAVSDANSCTTYTTQVLSMATLNFTINTINNLSCSCAGSIQITNVTGGVGPYSYAINPVANQPVPGTFDNMCGGIYTITVTDINNCTGTTVINFNQIQLNITTVNSQCNGVNDGSISCTVLFGAPPYIYTLNPGNIVNATGIFTNLAANIYTIDVVDANICSNSTIVTITDNTQINVSLINIDSVICGIDGGASFVANGNAPGPYTYTVQPGNIVNAIGVFNALSAGTYTLTVNNVAGCIKASPFDIIQVSALLPVAITSNVYDESCYLSGDGAIDIIPANPNGLTYFWNNGAVTQDLSNITSGNYEVKISNISGDCAIVHDTVNIIGAACGNIWGKVYNDANSNCVNDAGDYNVINVLLQLSNGAWATTNMAGNYQFSNVPYGNYVITQFVNAYMMPNACTQPANLTINAGNNNQQNVNFKDTTSSFTDVEVMVFGGAVVPGFNSHYNVNVWNNSALPMTGDLSFTLNNNLTLNNTVPLNQGVYPVAGGDSIVWTNISIAPFSFGTFYVSYFTPAAVPLGTLIQSEATVTVTNFADYIPANNHHISQMIAQGAFDPNDKTVNPIGEGPNGNITLQDSILNYSVRFQNTGTDSAHNIYIMDTLSDKLDITTFKVTGFSHPYNIEILNSNILKFKFDNIMLPDSNVNEPLSHGYIAYNIEQKNANQIGDVINNTASIFFDFNAPIVTNTTINTISFPSLLSLPEFEKYIHVYPNPATDKLTVEFNSNSNMQSSITMTNTLGQVVTTILANTINGKNKIEMSVKELPKGIFMLKLSNGKNQSMKKVVIE